MKLRLIICLLYCVSVLCGQDLAVGLVGYYSFCGCTANDHSGNGFHATLVGTPECTAGIRGEGFQFNTTPGDNGCGQNGGEYIELPVLGAIWESGLSFCAWVKYENIANFERIIDMGNDNGETGGLPVWFGREGNSNNLTLESWIDSNPNTNRTTGRLVANNAITNGQIEFYAATISATGEMKIYVNGVLKASKIGHPVANVERFHNYIGHSNWCQADPDFKGFMDEVRIYNRVLTKEEIFLMYDSPFFITGDDPVICEGGDYQLTATGGVNYEWYPDYALSTTDIANPVASPDVSTLYYCDIIFPDGCFITDSIFVEIAPCDCAGTPNGNAVIDICGECLDPLDSLFNQSCVDCAGVLNGKAVLKECGICLEPDDPLFDKSCDELLTVYIPNAFSPNADGFNDEFQVYKNGALRATISQYLIFNKWGGLIFEAKNFGFGNSQNWWDGTFKGKAVESGVYVYYVEVLFENGQVKTFTGDISVVR